MILSFPLSLSLSLSSCLSLSLFSVWLSLCLSLLCLTLTLSLSIFLNLIAFLFNSGHHFLNPFASISRFFIIIFQVEGRAMTMLVGPKKSI